MNDTELYLLETLRSEACTIRRLLRLAAEDGLALKPAEVKRLLVRLETQRLVRARGGKWEAIEDAL